jgi:hypothetical protein
MPNDHAVNGLVEKSSVKLTTARLERPSASAKPNTTANLKRNITFLLWFEGLSTPKTFRVDCASAVILTSGFKPSPFAFPVWVAVAPKRVRGKGFVASYSSATVADFHGVPCADVLRFSPEKHRAERLKELAGEYVAGVVTSRKLSLAARFSHRAFDVFGDEVDHHRVGHHRRRKFVGDAGIFLQRLLENKRDVYAQV